MAGEALSRLNQIEAECLRKSDLLTSVIPVHRQLPARNPWRGHCRPGGHHSGLGGHEKVPAFDGARHCPREAGLARGSSYVFYTAPVCAAHGVRSPDSRGRQVERSRHGFPHGDRGRRSPERHIARARNRTGTEKYVTVGGEVSEQDLPLMYGACDAFVLPTRSLECFGLIAIEALSAGRPVMATPVGAIPEVLRTSSPAGWRNPQKWTILPCCSVDS